MDSCLICSTALPPRGLAARDRLHGSPGTFVVVRCPTCGAGRTLPPATVADLAAYYPPDYGPFEATPGRLVQTISRAIRGWQGRRAGTTPPLASMTRLPAGDGLDVGCGRGDLAGWFVRRGWRMRGVEPSAGAAAAARALGVDVLEGVLATIELEDGSFDAVVFQQSLEHTEEPVEDLRRVLRALRPGGIVCISVPNFGCWQARRFGTRWFHLDVPRHRTHFTGASLTRALRTAGFTEVVTSTSTSPVGLPASIQYRMFGRCLFPGGLRLRVAAGLCVVTLPIAGTLNRSLGGGDVLHTVAVKPSGA